MQDLQAATSQDNVAAIAALTVASLDPGELQAVARLSIFPMGFDEDGASAVMGCGIDQTRARLKALCRQGLLASSGFAQGYVLQSCVRETLGKVMKAGSCSEDALDGFVCHMVSLFARWGPVFTSKLFKSTMSQARQHQADITEFITVLRSERDLSATAVLALSAAATPSLVALFGALGLMGTPPMTEAWEKVEVQARRWVHMIAFNSNLSHTQEPGYVTLCQQRRFQHLKCQHASYIRSHHAWWL